MELIKDHKIISLVVLVLVGFMIFFIYIFQDWPKVYNCSRSYEQFTINGTWFSNEDDEITFVDNSFYLVNLFEKELINGTFSFSKDGYVELNFKNGQYTDALKAFLVRIEQNYPQSDNYQNIDTNQLSIEIKIKFFFIKSLIRLCLLQRAHMRPSIYLQRAIILK